MSLRPCGCGSGRGIVPVESGGARNITGEDSDPIVPWCDVCNQRADLRGLGDSLILEDGGRLDLCQVCKDAGKTIR
jgi:hypothetical protein